MKTPKWILDEYMISASDIDIIKCLEDLDVEYTIIKNKPYYDDSDLPYSLSDCVIPYTSLKVSKYLAYHTGSFFNYDNLKFSNYFSDIQLDNNLWVNGDFVLTTFYDFSNNKEKYIKLFNTNKFFIRPDSGTKVFTGTVIDIDNFDIEINSLNKLTGVMPYTIILVSAFKEIISEYRFVIIDNEIVSGCEYNWNKDNKKGYPLEAFNLALKVSNANTQLEAYIVDIAKMKNNDYKILEINSFNCSSWYQCDVTKIIQKINEYVQHCWDTIYYV